MTAVLAPPSAPPEPAEPARRRHPARTLVTVTVGALLLAALLNPDDLVRRAEHLPYGWQRTATVRAADVNRSISRALRLDRPRAVLDRALGNGEDTSSGPAVVETTKVRPRRPTVQNPLRLYLGGDSVAQAFGDALKRAAARDRVLAPTVEFRFATGLARPDYYNWPAHLRKVLARKPRPEVVVVLFGANDVQPILTPGGPVRSGTQAWLAEYRRRVSATMDLLAGSGVDVYWVGQPPMRSADLNARIQQMDDVFAAEAAKHPGVTFVSSRPVLGDGSGGYAAYLPDASGRPVLVRASDGVHLTAAGADRLTRALLEAIGRRWPLPD